MLKSPSKFLNFLNINTLVLLIFMTNSACNKNDMPSTPQLLKIPYQSTVDNTDREYFVYLPEGYESDQNKKWPVMLFLHGDGERGNGNNELDYVLIHGPLYEAWIQKRDLPFIIISPQLHMFGRDSLNLPYIDQREPSWIPKRLEEGVPERVEEAHPDFPMTGAIPYDSMQNMSPVLQGGWDQCEEDLMAMIDYVNTNYRTDENRQYLTGLSYGGLGTWYLASKHPDKFTAIAPVVGWGHPDLMAPIANAKIPIWVFAGGRDQVVQTKYFFKGLNQLEESGHDQVRFTIHEDGGHDIWKRIYGGNDLYQWLLSKNK